MENLEGFVSLAGKLLEGKGESAYLRKGLQRDCKADILLIQRTFLLKRQSETLGVFGYCLQC
jgi:hypothetical protein